MHENKEEGRGFSRYHLRYGYKKTDRDRFVPRLNLLRLAMTQVFCCYGRTRLRYLLPFFCEERERWFCGSGEYFDLLLTEDLHQASSL